MSTKSDSPDPEESPESIEDLRSVLAGLEDEMETLKSSLTDFEESDEDVDPSLEDLEDTANQTRSASRQLVPREAPERLYDELGEEECDAIPAPGLCSI